MAENLALQIQEEEATTILSAIESEKQELMAAIYNKGLEKTWRQDQIVSNVSKFMIQHPEDTITHLHETFGNLVSKEPDYDNRMVQPEVHERGAQLALQPSTLAVCKDYKFFDI